MSGPAETGEKLLQKFKDSLDLGPEVEEKLMSMVNKYRELDSEGKAEFTEHVKETFKKSLTNYGSNFVALKFWSLVRSPAVLFVAVVMILVVFGTRD